MSDAFNPKLLESLTTALEHAWTAYDERKPQIMAQARGDIATGYQRETGGKIAEDTLEAELKLRAAMADVHIQKVESKLQDMLITHDEATRVIYKATKQAPGKSFPVLPVSNFEEVDAKAVFTSPERHYATSRRMADIYANEFQKAYDKNGGNFTASHEHAWTKYRHESASILDVARDDLRTTLRYAKDGNIHTDLLDAELDLRKAMADVRVLRLRDKLKSKSTQPEEVRRILAFAKMEDPETLYPVLPLAPKPKPVLETRDAFRSSSMAHYNASAQLAEVFVNELHVKLREIEPEYDWAHLGNHVEWAHVAGMEAVKKAVTAAKDTVSALAHDGLDAEVATTVQRIAHKTSVEPPLLERLKAADKDNALLMEILGGAEAMGTSSTQRGLLGAYATGFYDEMKSLRPGLPERGASQSLT